MEKINYRGITVTKYNNVLSVASEGKLLISQVSTNADDIFKSIERYISDIKIKAKSGVMIHISEVKKFILSEIER